METKTNNNNTAEECVFFDAARGQAHDVMMPDGRGKYGRKSVEEMLAEYPQGVVISWAEAARRTDDHFRKPPERITGERFNELLNILPPVAWVRRYDAESFKISERQAGNITCICVRRGQEFWKLEDHIRMPHADILALVDIRRDQIAREHAPAVFAVLREAVAALPAAWAKDGTPPQIGADVLARFDALDEANRDELLRKLAHELVNTLREVQAALPDAAFAKQHNVSRELIERIEATARKAEGWPT